MADNKKCILVADDEKDIRDILTLLLSGEGYNVIAACDGEEVIEKMSLGVDLFLLDINMPRLTGLAAAQRIRETLDTPIVFLTAYSGEADKIMGFFSGADDYIVKPFSSTELLLRIRAILRRSSASAKAERTEEAEDKSKIVIGDLTVDVDAQTVTKGGEAISLTFTEFKILELLAKNRKKIFSLENIYNSIWDDGVVGDSAIMVHIKNLRKKLSDNSRDPVYIKTAWGRGYYVD